MKFNLLLITLLLFSCTKSNQIPDPTPPQFSLANPNAADVACESHDFSINFEFESYSIDGGETFPWNTIISGWIPDETDPTFYLISYDWRFCNFLELALEDYSFTVEEISNPDGYWYEVTTSETEFAALLNGATLTGKLEKFKNCNTRNFEFNLNSEMYTFGGPWKEFDDNFDAYASFQPVEILIYSDNVALCDYLDLELAEYSYTFEAQPTPHYRVSLPEADLVLLVNGMSLGGQYEYRRKFVAVGNGPKLE